MRVLLFLLLACFLTACGQRSIPETTALRERPSAPIYVPTKRELIIVDAGHGGKDAGTSSVKEDYEEKKLTLETALIICDYLRKLGYKTQLTRSQDIYIPLETRADIANNMDADVFVSIHYNFSSSKEASGVEVYYYKDIQTPLPKRIVKSKELCQEVLKTIIKSTGAESRGVKQANFAVVRKTKMPAILVEGGFLSNPKEREKIKDAKYLHSLAKGIAQGVDQYLKAERR